LNTNAAPFPTPNIDRALREIEALADRHVRHGTIPPLGSNMPGGKD
jgi:hypothetical protein